MITNADQGILLTWAYDGPGTATIAANGVVPVAALPAAPVLQAQDGSYFGAACTNNGQPCPPQYNSIVAFDLTGNTRWIVPNDAPQIATADGGVIGQSGITYDQNGNATGMMATATESWIQQAYTSTGGQASALQLPAPVWATSYTAMEGGSPSSNGTAVGVTTVSVNGTAFYALPNRGPGCQLAVGDSGGQFPLGGAALTQYNNEKQALVAGNYLTSTSCSNFFNGTVPGAQPPARATYFSQLTAGVQRQSPYDGLQTEISAFDAGFASSADMSDPTKARAMAVLKNSPVCGQFVSWWNPKGTHYVPPGTRAASQISSGSGLATFTYVNTNASADLTQADILHEALHNITGMYDGTDSGANQSLEVLLGLNPQTNCKLGTICISELLRSVGCAGAN
jgi:hypothetical protein